MELIVRQAENYSKYIVSEDGYIFKLNKDYSLGKKMKSHLTHNGYLRLILIPDSGGYKNWFVHRFVAEAYLENKPSEIHQINHKNLCKTDNSVNNIEWVTCKENLLHSWQHNGPRVGERIGTSKNKEHTIIQVYECLQQGFTTKETLDFVPDITSKHVVNDIRSGKAWKHIAENYDFSLVRLPRLPK